MSKDGKKDCRPPAAKIMEMNIKKPKQPKTKKKRLTNRWR